MMLPGDEERIWERGVESVARRWMLKGQSHEG